jgi:hypothetical protein
VVRSNGSEIRASIVYVCNVPLYYIMRKTESARVRVRVRGGAEPSQRWIQIGVSDDPTGWSWFPYNQTTPCKPQREDMAAIRSALAMLGRRSSAAASIGGRGLEIHRVFRLAAARAPPLPSLRPAGRNLEVRKHHTLVPATFLGAIKP